MYQAGEILLATFAFATLGRLQSGSVVVPSAIPLRSMTGLGLREEVFNAFGVSGQAGRQAALG